MQQGSALVVEAEMARREAEAVVERMGAAKDETEIDVSTCHVIGWASVQSGRASPTSLLPCV